MKNMKASEISSEYKKAALAVANQYVQLCAQYPYQSFPKLKTTGQRLWDRTKLWNEVDHILNPGVKRGS